MLISSFKNVLDDFCSNEYKSLLLKGKWGIGKTYIVRESLNELKSNYDYSYFSLFGIDSLDSLMARILEKIDSKDIVISNRHIFFSDNFVERKFNNHIIVFDDLERVADSFQYESILGVVDSLIKLGFKIIGIAHSDAIKKENFKELIEKAFERIVSVEADYKLLNKIIGDDEIQASQSIIKDADSNWRIVKRAYYSYCQLLAFFAKNNFNDFFDRTKFSKASLFRCVIIATNCFFCFSENKPVFDKNDEFDKISYEIDVDNLGEYAANKFYSVFKNNENSSLKDLTRVLIKCLKNGSFDLLIEDYYPDKKDYLINSYPFDKDYFFYDDKGKESFRKEFLSRLSEFDFSKRSHLSIARSVLLTSIDKLSDKDQYLIIKRMIETIDDEGLSSSIDLLGSEDKEKQDLLTIFKEKFNKVVLKKHENARNTLLDNLFKTKDYASLTDFLYKNRYDINDKNLLIAEKFSESDFLLPDLSSTIDYTVWSYCHEIARFVSKYENYVEKFIGVLEKQCSLKKSRTLVDRCNALVYYNFKDSKHFRVFK